MAEKSTTSDAEAGDVREVDASATPPPRSPPPTRPRRPGCCGPAVSEVVSTTDAQGCAVFGATATTAPTPRRPRPPSPRRSAAACRPPSPICTPARRCSTSAPAAGADVLISARRVGPTGKAIGLDMTDEMLVLARRNAADAGLENVEFVKGYIEAIPLADASVDVVISNCVLNLSGDKPKVLAEAARVLRDGGRFAISDVIADDDMDDATRADMRQWTGCVAGALTRAEFEQALAAAGLVEIEITETHRVHEHAAAAIIRARKPAGA